MKYISLVCVSVFLFSSCAAMFNGTSSQVSVRSNEDNAELYVNEAFIGKNSGLTVLKKKKIIL